VASIFTQIKRLFPFRGKRPFFLKPIIGYTPKAEGLFKMALLHKSAQQKGHNGAILSNERLEFLGDAILGAVIAMELYKLFPDKDEGALTKMRSRIVNRVLLNEVGLKMGLAKQIKCQSQLDISQTHILGDAVEALIGAVFLDKGFATAKAFILESIIKPHYNLFDIALTDSNFKSLLIEWGHKQRKHIEFKTHEINHGQEAPLLFVCKVMVDDIECGDGSGTSKKEAQQNAARTAYTALINNTLPLGKENHVTSDETRETERDPS
jgi:ribonuclease III